GGNLHLRGPGRIHGGRGGGRRAVPCRSRGVSGLHGLGRGRPRGRHFSITTTEGSSMERSLTNLLNRGVDPHLKGTVKRSGPRAIPSDAENTIRAAEGA